MKDVYNKALKLINTIEEILFFFFSYFCPLSVFILQIICVYTNANVHRCEYLYS